MLLQALSALLVGNLLELALGLVMLAGLLALLHLQERMVSRHIAHHLGWRAVLLTGWLGVPLHELSHLALAKLFGHRLIAWKLLDPDPVSGTLGYVRHAYSRRSLWQLVGTFFIGIAPALSGAGLLLLLLWWMLPTDEQLALLRQASALTLGSPATVAGRLGELCLGLGAATWRSRSLLLPLQLYLAVCVAAHMAPSGSDLRGSWPGLLLLVLLLALLAGAAAAGGLSLRGLAALAAPLLLLLPLTTTLLLLWALLAGLLGRMPRAVTSPRARRA